MNSFFMRESPDILEKVLKEKVKELKSTNEKLQKQKEYSERLNLQLQISLKKTLHAEKELLQQTKLLEWEVKHKTDEALKAVKFSILGQLAAGVAHDLRNPLGIIRNNTIILKRKFGTQVEEAKLDIFDRMDRAITRMSHQINDVMDIVKTAPIIRKKHSLLEIIYDSKKAILDFENVTLNIPKNDVELDCDPEKLTRVFVNLILNGIDAIEGAKGEINIRFGGTKNVVIEVEDSGKEISEENLKNFFQAFFTTKQKGTGLGLLTCKNIIEQHGGVIQVSANPTIVKIVLPKKSAKVEMRH